MRLFYDGGVRNVRNGAIHARDDEMTKVGPS